MIDNIFTQLNDSSNIDMNRYLLFDGLSSISGLHSLHINKLKERFGLDKFSTVLRPEIAYAPKFCPQLFLLAKSGELIDKELIEQSVDLAFTEYLSSKRYICGWIVSEKSIDELSQYMVSIGSALGTTIEDTLFTPFYEPIRLQLLQEANIICKDWLPTVMHGINKYYYLTMDMKLGEVVRPIYRVNIQNLFITEETKYYQRHAKEINYLYIGWGSYCKDNNRQVNSGDLIKLASLHQQANLLGLTNVQDNFVYSLNTMQFGNLLKNETILTEIKATILDEGTLAKRFNELDELFTLLSTNAL